MDFEFDLTMPVTSFTMQTMKGGDLTPPMNAKGNKFTPEMQTLLAQAKRGQKFWFENIYAKAPEGPRKLSPINLVIR